MTSSPTAETSFFNIYDARADVQVQTNISSITSKDAVVEALPLVVSCGVQTEACEAMYNSKPVNRQANIVIVTKSSRNEPCEIATPLRKGKPKATETNYTPEKQPMRRPLLTQDRSIGNVIEAVNRYASDENSLSTEDRDYIMTANSAQWIAALCALHKHKHGQSALLPGTYIRRLQDEGWRTEEINQLGFEKSRFFAPKR